jgi:diguanylate cyclase (GGDEF)-like protein/PAS domain S-box-containing protein
MDARQALGAVDGLSRAVVDGLEEGVVVTDASARTISFNPSALRILGVDAVRLADAEPLLGDGSALTLPDGSPLTEDASPIRRALQTGEPVRAELRRPGPEELWITVLARPIGDGDGDGHERRGVVCTFDDVTATVVSERRLREERDRAQRYLDVAGTLVVVLDDAGRVELINRQGCELLGFQEEELLGRDWFGTVVPAADRLDARLAFMRLVSGVDAPGSSLEAIVETRQGERRTIAWRNAVLHDSGGRITSVLRSGEDVTERKRAEAQVAFLAYHDRLTGLANRTLLEEQVRRDLGRARRTGGSLALLYFDLDNFKLVNDSLGHQAGDAVLAEAARRVAELTRSGDVLARQGGDEFLLLLSASGDQDARKAAQAAGERIAAALDEPFEISDARFHVGASIGIALYPEHASDADMLFKQADSAMYQAKRSGGGTVAFYEPQDTDARERLSLTSRLRRAIRGGELRLHVQPIVDVHDDRVVAVEALVRWQDPETGLIPPAMFIGVAEETGLIDGIGDWVLEQLCAHGVRWRDANFDPLLTFNLSPRQLRRSDLVASITSTIERHGLEPDRFCAELTESAILSDERSHRSTLAQLADAGFALAIDDFGSGHSSLGRLRDLPVQMLKVDRSFLGRVPHDPGSSAIVSAVLMLGSALGTTTVVEGVEEPEQLEYLRAQGASLAQGFLLGRPVPAEKLMAANLSQEP